MTPIPAGRYAPDLALIGAAFVWGLSFVVVKGALEDLGPQWLVAIRFALAVAVLLLIEPRLFARLDGGAWAAGLGLGVLLYAGFALQTEGLVHTTPSRSAFLTGCSVLMVPFFERLLLGQAVRPMLLVGIALATLGLWLLLDPGNVARLNRGDLLTLGCALGFALHISLLGRHAPRFRTRHLATVQLLAVSALGGAAAFATEVPRLTLPARAWAAIAFLGIVCSALAFAAQTWAQRRTPPSRVGLLLSLEPVFAVGAAVLLWGERLTLRESAGGALVVLAIVAVEATRKR